jgi:hypothetical protein
MDRLPDPEFFLKSTHVDPNLIYGSEGGSFYSEAKCLQTKGGQGRSAFWHGNFFPNMRAWDDLLPQTGRGAGAHVVWIRYPDAALLSHMAVFGSGTYKKGHRHGPGILIVIPDGEGYSYIWKQGEEKILIPWHEGSVFVPPRMYFHQHFNISDQESRYLAFHSLTQGGDRADAAQIEYTEEDPMIRDTFEKRLAERNLTSLMPDDCYRIPGYEWSYTD